MTAKHAIDSIALPAGQRSPFNTGTGILAGMNDRLRSIKILHTVAWAFFVGCILALPAAASLHWFRCAAALAAVVLMECAVLAVNRCRCPLTSLAARYTENRSPNFDIYLPPCLAQYNKQIFGAIFVAGLLYAAWKWRGF
jgi:hypothetical protein